ncbi:MAG: UMP kinase [Nanoarchaeota archaeon]|nr:UMP kinase [Nanoarchaeota archaeon]
MFVISLGGSLICPDEIDIAFLHPLRELVLSYVEKGAKFALICGGGGVARKYQEAASKLAPLSDGQKDWLGIEATRMNAMLLHSIFPKELTFGKLVSDPSETITTNAKIIVCCGWKPGHSTDYDAVLLAKQFGTGVINLTNTEYVYDKDPKKYADAKPLKSVSWKEFRTLVGSDWKPGMNAPFDPIAAKEAEASGLKVTLAGKDLQNLRNILDGKAFKGTTIS